MIAQLGAVVSPERDTGRLQPAVEGTRNLSTGARYSAGHAAAQILPHAAAEPKRLATARARAALLGVIVHSMRDDAGRPEYVATQGPWTVSLKSLDELETWLDRIEGRHA